MRLRIILLLVLPLLGIGCAATPPPAPATTPTASEYFNEGKRLYDQGQYQGAAEIFDRATELNPNFAEAFFWKGNAFNKMNATDQAIDAYLQALQIQPNHAQANLEVARLYFSRFQYTPAEAHLKKAIDANPANPEAYYYLAEIYSKKGLCKEPKELYQKALSIQPTFYDASEGLKEVSRRNCVVARKSTPKSAPKPQYEKRTDFEGGGRALRDDEW